MATGTVKFFREDKGFGFIANPQTGTEIFVHISGCVDKIQKGDNVEYDEQEGPKGKGPVAVNVKKV